jgi:hypothetical protein
MLLVVSLSATMSGPLSLGGIRYSNKSSRRKPVSFKMRSASFQMKEPNHFDALPV